MGSCKRPRSHSPIELGRAARDGSAADVAPNFPPVRSLVGELVRPKRAGYGPELSRAPAEGGLVSFSPREPRRAASVQAGSPGLLDDLDDAVGTRIDQHWPVVHYRVAIIADAILGRHLVIGHT